MAVDYQKTTERSELIKCLERALSQAEEYGDKDIYNSIYEVINSLTQSPTKIKKDGVSFDLQ